MKKLVYIIVTIMIFAIFPHHASGFFAPLNAPYWAASVDEESPIELVSYNALLDVQKDVVNVKIESVVRNSSDEKADVIVGLPQQFNNGTTKIVNPEVYVNGVKQKLSTRNDETNVDTTSLKELPSNWISWNINFPSKGSKVVEILFTLERDIKNGVSDVVLPLSYLNPFKGAAANIHITAKAGSFPYITLETNPTIIPDSFNVKGEMEWVFSNIDTIPDIKFKANDLGLIIESLLLENAEDTNKVKNIMEYYKKMEYDSAISEISSYFKEYTSTIVRPELTLLQGLSNRAISNTASVKTIYGSLAQNESTLKMPNVLKNHILFEVYLANKGSVPDDQLNEYLLQYKPYIEGNDIMGMYLQELIENIPEPETEEEETKKDPDPKPSKTPASSNDDELVKFVEIGGVKIPVEFIFLGAFVIIVLIILYARRRRNRRKTYLFRF